MLGAVPNPKKSFEIDFNSQDVFDKIQHLSLVSKYKFTSRNEVLKTYRFESFELLSLGIYADISVSSINQERTKIEIEILRKVGAFDKSFEVSQANRHISEISEGISKCVTFTSDQIEALEQELVEEQNIQDNKKWHEDWPAPFLLLSLFPPAGIILIWKNGNFNIFFRLILTAYSILIGLLQYLYFTGQLK